MQLWPTALRCSQQAAHAVRRLLSSMGELDGDFSEPPYPGGWKLRWRLTRPSIPPMLMLALGLWVGILAVLAVLFEQERLASLAVMLGSIPLAALAAFLLYRTHQLSGCLALGLALGMLLAGMQAARLLDASEMVGSHEQGAVLTLTRDARPGEFGASALARTQDGVLVRLNLSEEADLRVGDVIAIDADWKAPSPRSARQSWQSGVAATGSVRGYTELPQATPIAWLHSLRRAALAVLDQAAQEVEAHSGVSVQGGLMLLRAVLLGSVDGLYTSALYQDVKVCGLAHLVAVSGAHLAIICGFIMVLFRRAAIARSVAVVLQLGLIAGYLVLTGAPVSAIRAAIMASLALLSFFSQRRPYALGGLSCGMALMLIHDPACAYSASFTLSVLSTLGIVLFSRMFSSWLVGERRVSRGVVSESLSLTLAATVLTLPYCASQFGQVSLISPVANLVATPVFTLVCVGGFASLLLSAVVPPLGLLAIAAVLVLGQLFCVGAALVAGIPNAAIPTALPDALALVLSAVVPVLLWRLWPRPTTRNRRVLAGLAAAAFAFCLLWRPTAGDALVMLDVGQGDAILLRSGQATLLVDTGTQDIELLEGLARCGVRQLDAVLVSHPDDDHCGSLAALRGVVPVGSVMVAAELMDSHDANGRKLLATARQLVGDAGLVGLSAGDVLGCGAFRIYVVGPERFVDGGGNADSLVLLAEADCDGDGAGEHTALLVGDVESERLAAYTRDAALGPVEIYKVGHHGSRKAIDAPLARQLQPRVSLVSVGSYNRYGHPVPSTLETLEEVGSRVYRTDLQGSITCQMHPDSLEVRTER